MTWVNTAQQVLIFLPINAGSVVAAAATRKLAERKYRRHAEKAGLPTEKSAQIDLIDYPIERARLKVALPMFSLCTVSMICYG
jgi:hypothetical protein